MRRLLYIFIPILAIFLMSHNASALDLTINLNDYENLNYNPSPDWYDYVITNSSGTVVRTCNQTYVCAWRGDEQLRVAKTHKTFSLKTGDIVTYKLNVYSPSAVAGVDYLNFRQLTPGGGINNLYFHKVHDFQSVGPDGISWSCNASNTSCDGLISGESYRYSAEYEVANIITSNGTYSLGSINQNTIDGVLYGTLPSGQNNLTVGVSNFNVYRKNKSAVNQEQEEATQEAADDSADAGDSSSSDAENASSSLISAIGGFVNAITSASPSNCNIDGDMGYMDLGTVDLCANPVPTFVQIISSLVLIAICIPFAIIMFNRFIGMFRSFQG